MLLGIGAVELVIGTHHRPGIGLLDGDLEILEVDLPQRPLADAGVVLRAVGFLAVRREMLDGSAHAIALDAAHIGRRHLSRQHRILREILEVSATEGVAVDVHPGGEQHVHPVLQHLIAHHGRRLLHQGRIPGTGQQGTHGKARRHRMLRIPVRVDADAGGAVGKHRLGNAQARNGAGAARRAGHQVVRAHAHHERRFLLQGHRLKDLIDIVRPELRLRLKDRTAEQQNCQKRQLFFHGKVISFRKYTEKR